MQLLNLVRGGGIDQHLEDPDAIHRAAPGSFTPHPISADPSSRLGAILGPGPLTVRSHHHQGLARLGRDLAVSARSPDGLIEAIEATDPDHAFCLAVLWHPEEDLEGGGGALYAAFVEAARLAAGGRASDAGVGSRA